MYRVDFTEKCFVREIWRCLSAMMIGDSALSTKHTNGSWHYYKWYSIQWFIWGGGDQGKSPLTGFPEISNYYANVYNLYHKYNHFARACGSEATRKSQRLEIKKNSWGSMPPDSPSLSVLQHVMISSLSGFYLGQNFEGETERRVGQWTTLAGQGVGVGGGCTPSHAKKHGKLKHIFLSEFSKSHLNNTSGDLYITTDL